MKIPHTYTFFQQLTCCVLSLITEVSSTEGVINMALNKEAMQAEGHSPWLRPASYAVDGNTDGDWRENSCSETALLVNPWWAVDFGWPMSIGYLSIKRRTDANIDRLRDFIVGARMTSPADVPQGQMIDVDQCKDFVGVPLEHMFNVTCEPVATWGRYLVIQQQGQERLNLCEVEVYTAVREIGNWSQSSDPSAMLSALGDSQTSTCVELASLPSSGQVLLRAPLAGLMGNLLVDIYHSGITWTPSKCVEAVSLVLVEASTGAECQPFCSTVLVCMQVEAFDGRSSFICDCTRFRCGVLSLHLPKAAAGVEARLCHVEYTQNP